MLDEFKKKHVNPFSQMPSLYVCVCVCVRVYIYI